MPRLFGYTLPDKWLMQYAARHNLDGADDQLCATFNTILHLIPLCGLRRVDRCRSPEDPEEKVFCFAIGDDGSEEGLAAITTERIQIVKAALERTDEPVWLEQ